MSISFTSGLAGLAAAAAIAGCSQLIDMAPEPADGPRALDGPSGAIYIDDGGSGGLPVIFLHSFGGDSSHWASQLDHLRHHRRALAIDLRGHGKSARPNDDDYSVKAFVRDLESVVKELKLQRFVLVGHSLGAAIANAYAAEHPRRVAGVVLVGAPGRTPPAQSAQVLASLDADYEKTMQGYMDRLTAEAQPHVKTELERQMAKMPREDSMAIMKSLFAYDPLPAFDRYKGSRLLIYATQPGAQGGLHAARPQARQKAFEGTSHWPHMDQPKEFNAVLDEFLAGLD